MTFRILILAAFILCAPSAYAGTITWTCAGGDNTYATGEGWCAADIQIVENAVDGNAADIATNASGISTNASGISTNASGISGNDSDIVTLAGSIATNLASITALEGLTFTECETIYAPTEFIAATDDIPSVWRASDAITITEVWCETDQTVTLDLQIDDGTPADVMGSDLSCGTGTADSTSLTGSMADGDRLDLLIATASGSPTLLTFCWEYTID